jgi:seryl-tRNA synthetase
VAIMENFQRSDGAIEVPQVLRPLGAPAVVGPS